MFGSQRQLSTELETQKFSQIGTTRSPIPRTVEMVLFVSPRTRQQLAEEMYRNFPLGSAAFTEAFPNFDFWTAGEVEEIKNSKKREDTVWMW